MVAVTLGINQYYSTNNCDAVDGCPTNVCPDIVLKKNDTNPAFRVAISDCDGSLDLSDPYLIVEVNMWSKAKLKRSITASDTVIEFADGVGFDQVLVDDVLYFNHVRAPEMMTVESIDEIEKEITVSRDGTVRVWKKGSPLVIYRIKNASGSIETILGDIVDETGVTLTDQLIDTNLLYQWDRNDTLLPGCYWLEFKLVKLNPPNSETFDNVDVLKYYAMGSPPIFVNPNLTIVDDSIEYEESSFVLNPVIADDYDYFTIVDTGNADISIVVPEDGEGTITVTSEFINDGISIIPVIDQGATVSTISVINDIGGQVQSIQPGLVFATQGELVFDGTTIGSFTTGAKNTPLIVLFNSSATKAGVEAVLQNIVFVNLSSSPSEITRKFTYQFISGDGNLSDLHNFYLGIDSMPPVEDLEGIEWVRRFPSDREGFLVKIAPTGT